MQRQCCTATKEDGVKKSATQTGKPHAVWTKHEPPGVEEALFAAAGLTEDAEERIELAAQLIGRPVDEVRLVARRIGHQHAITIERPTMSLHRPDDRRSSAPRTVIVERVRTRSLRLA
jgi:hypothetical protein